MNATPLVQEKNDSQSGVSNLLILIVLIISIVLNVISIYFLVGTSFGISALNDPLGIKRAVLEVEYDKVGGKTNYDLLNQAQLIQFQQTLPQLKEFVAKQGGATASGDTVSASQSPSGTLTSEELADIRKDAAVEGNADAPITVIEYSDMECPFCIKQYHDTKLNEKLMAQYGSGVNFIFKNNIGVNHEGTEEKALAALCAQKVGGDDAYIAYYHGVMDGSADSRNVYPVSDLAKLAQSLKIDMVAWQKCYDAKETDTLFKAQTAEAMKFNLGGTPGTLIINNTTGKYDVVEGAYPYETFTTKIDQLSK